jgi:SAM-dependent methyltransferase
MQNIDISAILDEQRTLSHTIAAQMNVAPEISPDDMLFDFLIRAVFPTDHPKAVDAYFTGGQACAQRFAALCREHLQSEPKTVLEFASGYGRVARHAKHVLPVTSWTCSDVHRHAVEFNTDRLGLDSFISTSRPEGWTVERRFDVVFALSFFSHMPDATFTPWLERLFSTVEHDGILVFTTHGAISLRNMKAGGFDANFNENGFYWNAQSDQRDIDSTDYGTSAETLSYVQRALESLPEAELTRFQQAFWWGHQDLYVVRKRPLAVS